MYTLQGFCEQPPSQLAMPSWAEHHYLMVDNHTEPKNRPKE